MDNTQLDQYVATLATRLKTLPAPQRDEELREVRQHLEALVAGHVAGGHSQAAATELALRQFGRAEQVGRELDQVQRRRPKLWVSLAVYACMVLVIFAFYATANDKPTDFPYGWANQLLFAVVLPASFLAFQVGRYMRFSK